MLSIANNAPENEARLTTNPHVGPAAGRFARINGPRGLRGLRGGVLRRRLAAGVGEDGDANAGD